MSMMTMPVGLFAKTNFIHQIKFRRRKNKPFAARLARPYPVGSYPGCLVIRIGYPKVDKFS